MTVLQKGPTPKPIAKLCNNQKPDGPPALATGNDIATTTDTDKQNQDYQLTFEIMWCIQQMDALRTHEKTTDKQGKI